MSYDQSCSNCEKKFTAAGNYCPFCGESIDATTMERRVTITEAGDGGLLVGEREVVDRVDDICSKLEALQEEIDDPAATAALRAATGNAWRASVLHRIAKNSDIRMIADTNPGTASVSGPEPAAYERERGESR